MANLAIKGHPTRGKEVIEILKMLGGKNDNHCTGGFIYRIYFINDYWHIESCNTIHHLDYIQLTLEEFLEKFPYKVGDKVQHKGATSYGSVYKITDMRWGENTVKYTCCLLGFEEQICWTAIAEQLQPFKEVTTEEKIESFEILESYCADEVKIEFDSSKFEMVKRDSGYFVVKKQPSLPQTYEECCKVVVAQSERHWFYTKKDKHDYPHEIKIINYLDDLKKLLICRDAYWKIARDWRPEFKLGKKKYSLTTKDNKIIKATVEEINRILVFPTEEMRDTFYENFKDLIEQCKEVL